MTFRRAVLFILVFALLLGCAALPAGAEHTHHWVDGPNIQQPTCTEPGWKTQYCDCGQSRDVQLPALGHEFSQQVYTGYADCTHYGSFYWVCERCGAHSAIGNDKPLGHDWDEGVITKAPRGFTPGEKTYTCKRDPSHTYTEEVEPTEWLFGTLEGDFVFQGFTDGSIELRDIPPLVIVKQPEGGYVNRDSDEGFELSIEVEGGEPSYSYEWHSGFILGLEGAKKVATIMTILFHGDEEKYNKLVEKILDDHVVGDDEPVCYATEGNRGYWCEVSDSKGRPAVSEVAKVKYKLEIVEQPVNCNIVNDGIAYLECKAQYGSGSYSYPWFKVNKNGGEDIFLNAENPIPITEEGEYYCRVTDEVTGETVESVNALVYVAPPIKVTVRDITNDPLSDHSLQELWPEEEGVFMATVSGGMPPYEVQLTRRNDDTYRIAQPDESGNVFTVGTDKAGWYTVDVTDSAEAKVYTLVIRKDRKLNVARQPVGARIQKYDYELISVAVSDGVLPIHYTLYRNGLVYDEATEDSTEATMEVFDPGSYYFKIEDAKGHWCYSASAVFDMAKIGITNYTPSAEILSPDVPAKLYVKAEGGVGPYDYYWIRVSDGGWTTMGHGSNEFSTIVPGNYFCLVIDAEKDSAYSKTMTVTQRGNPPAIVEQPKSFLNGDLNADGSVYGATLACDAVSATGDDSGLRYDWYRLAGIFPTSWRLYETNSRVIHPTVPGYYRCMVTDLNTGDPGMLNQQYAYSNIAAVSAKLSVEAVPTGNGGHIGAFGEYRYTIKGGLPPYKLAINLSSKNVTMEDDGYLRYTPFEETYITYPYIRKENAVGEQKLDMYHYAEYWDIFEQKTSYKWVNAEYSFLVNDAAGAFDSTELINVFNDYRMGDD